MAGMDPGYLNESFISTSNGGDDEYEMRMQDIDYLHRLCDAANDEESWEEVRQWLRTHTTQEIEEGAQKQGEFQTTALHLACRNCPPIDIIENLLNAAPDIVRWADSFGWLPLHYACANGATEDVLRILADAFPESKTATDRRGRTPLHFALGNTDSPPTAAAVYLLSSTGAASCPDENGMLPLHYACAYGAPEEALHVLTDNNADSITQTDRNGRTPLHFALGNADRQASPSVVKLLLSENPDVVNMTDKDRADLPLHLLATRAHTLSEAQKAERDNAMKCLDLYLDAKPHPTAAFLAALQSLPEWLRDRAVVAPTVKRVLNDKISQRFPTAILFLDLIFLVEIIVCYTLSVSQSIEQRFDDSKPDAVSNGIIIPLYIGAVYFLIREVTQMLSLQSLGLFHTWLTSSENWIDVTFIFIVLFSGFLMNTGSMMDAETFRTYAGLSFIILWGNVIYFLKSFLIDFAIFVNALYYIIRHLLIFLVALSIILVAFAQIFNTLFTQTSKCPDKVPENEENSFCDFWTSVLKVITMLLGEVDQNDFKGYNAATFFFALFFFLVVILLAQILIAIVTDSYGVVKYERAAIVFWSNRLDFVAEMDVIRVVLCKSRGEVNVTDPSENYTGGQSDTFRELWKKLMDLYEDELDDHRFFSFDTLCMAFMKVITALVIIPAWIVVGSFSVGLLWPPQVREFILTQRITKGTSDLKDSEQRTIELKELSKEVAEVQNEIVAEMSANWSSMVSMERQLTEMRAEMTSEMNHIKQIMTMLFDLQSSMIDG
mmetsp:Transcript_1396/g.2001  ORF Transcript_1396/g.2001 Transcript_1396/m.2001 type:complete len:776 (-) Transcript_1396:107-2434(-)